MKKISKALYLSVWIVLGILVNLIYLVGMVEDSAEYTWDEWLGISLAVSMLSVFLVILTSALINRSWRTVQGEKDALAPARAWGFMLIPIFNYYWIFQSVGSFSSVFNRMVKRRGLQVPVLNDNLFLAFCIVTVSSSAAKYLLASLGAASPSHFGAQITWFLNLAFFITGAMVINQVCNSLNAMAALNAVPAGNFATRPVGSAAPDSAASLVCPVCGSLSRPDAQFCWKCGTVFNRTEPDVQPDAGPVSVMAEGTPPGARPHIPKPSPASDQDFSTAEGLTDPIPVSETTGSDPRDAQNMAQSDYYPDGILDNMQLPFTQPAAPEGSAQPGESELPIGRDGKSIPKPVADNTGNNDAARKAIQNQDAPPSTEMPPREGERGSKPLLICPNPACQSFNPVNARICINCGTNL